MKAPVIKLEWFSGICVLTLALVAGGCANRQPVYSNGDADPRSVSGNAGLTNASIGSSATASSAATDKSGMPDARQLSVGDHLSFQILEDHEDPKQLIVSDSGEVDVPYLGHVSTTGLTCKALAQQIKKDLEAKYYYHATVEISVDSLSRTLGKIYASGALRNPGPQTIPGDEVFTLSKAVLCAGGFSDFADKHSVKVTRKTSVGTNEYFTVDVGQILEKGRTALDLALKDGDMVFVPERIVRF